MPKTFVSDELSDQQKRDAMQCSFLDKPWIQSLITMQMGLPHTGQKLRDRRPYENLISAVVFITLGTSSCALALCGHLGLLAYPMLVLGWAMNLAALRNARLPNRHACAHGELSGNRMVDRWIGQVISALLLLQPMSTYTKTHVSDPYLAHHRWQTLMTPGEATFEEIRDLGFIPGVPKHENWCRLRQILLSPGLYGMTLVRGLHAAFLSGSLSERCLNGSLWGFILFSTIASNSVGVFLVSYLIPWGLSIGAQVLRVCVEHSFLDPDLPRNLASYRTMTSAIILADPLPGHLDDLPEWKRCLSLSCWALKMLRHVPSRCFVCTGDTINHPVHHLRPGASFINHERERVALIAQGLNVPSNWGLVAAIDAFFDSLSKQPADLFDRPSQSEACHRPE